MWLALQYLIGFERLGYDPYYVEAHACPPYTFMLEEGDNGAPQAAAFLSELMNRFGFGDRWAYHALHDDGQCYGLTQQQLDELYGSAALLLNLHGATEPLPEHTRTDRLVYINTDPVMMEMRLYHNPASVESLLRSHCAIFTWGLNQGNPDCKVPVSEEFVFRPSPPPVVMDLWKDRGPAGDRFTTIGNWRQNVRYRFGGQQYQWSKHFEFLKFIDVPQRSAQRFELALAKYTDEDQQMLESKGWSVRDAVGVSKEIDAYRDYIVGSRGEFTVAKDLNVSTRSGWFSERSATYLAAGRPVITQETGFSNFLPSGTGLFGFSTTEEAVDAVLQIASDYRRHSDAASAIARDYLNYDVVLGNMLKVLDA